MTKKEIKDTAKEICVESKEFNSNNAWGFGGAYGMLYKFADNSFLKIGTACFRHTGTAPIIVFYYPDEDSRYRTENRKEIEALITNLKINKNKT